MCTTADIIDDDVVEDSPEYFEAVFSLIPTDRVTVDPERTRIQIFDNDRELRGTGLYFLRGDSVPVESSPSILYSNGSHVNSYSRN